MTAINALILPNETHVFADAGRFLKGTTIVCGLGPKITKLGNNQVFLFCGDDADGEKLGNCIKALPDASRKLAFPEIVKTSLISIQPYTAFLFGAGWGIAVEENGRIYQLSPTNCNEVKTIRSDFHLDPMNIVHSGITLAQDQRNRTGVVAGWLDYARITLNSLDVTTIYQWEKHLG